MSGTPHGLDWSGDKRRNSKAVNHWMGGRRLPCRICGRLTFLCDSHGTACHKVCAETETVSGSRL
ncbi:hypothetical protein Skr01_57300 [Sphaerisporangium krabiense]|nr:hypothetical protein Skr01_57300 [Sphaerisporangium krabiense]